MSRKFSVVTPNNIAPLEIYRPEWIDLSAVEPKSQPWLWPGMIPYETSTLLAGYGGIGKSIFLTFLGSHVTTGKSFQCCGEVITLDKGSVILCSAEDREDTHIVPNLLAANADISKVHLIKSTIEEETGKRKFLELDKELNIIEDKIKEVGDVKLIIFDPISYFIGDTKDHIQTEVANFIQAINDLSNKYSLASILSKHMRKKSGKQSISTVVDEVGGSAAWVNTPRQNFAFMNHPIDQEKVLIFNMKANITKKKLDAWAYKIKEKIINIKGKNIVATHIEWMDKKENIDICDAINKESFNKSKEQAAEDVIYNQLNKNGATSAEELIEICKKLEISRRTCQRVYGEMAKEGLIKKQPGIKRAIFELVGGWEND